MLMMIKPDFSCEKTPKATKRERDKYTTITCCLLLCVYERLVGLLEGGMFMREMPIKIIIIQP